MIIKKQNFLFLIVLLVILPLSFGLSGCHEKESERRDIRFPRKTEISLEGTPFFFYIPSEEEFSDYLSYAGYLADLESGQIEVTDEQISDLFKQMYSAKNIHGLKFEAFLWDVKNPTVRESVIRCLDSENVDPEFKKALLKKYHAEREVDKGKDQKEKIRYKSGNDYFDENITLFDIAQTTFYDGSLSLLLYQNNWQSMGFSPEPNIRSFALATGGETNSLALNFGEYSFISFEDFFKVAENSLYRNKYSNWQLNELPVEGILKQSGANRIFLGCGEGEDSSGESDSAAAVLYFYNEENQKGYEIVSYMNYTDKNIGYSQRARQCNLILFDLLFAKIK